MIRVWRCQPGDRISDGTNGGTVTKVGTKWLHVQLDSGTRTRYAIEGADGFDPRIRGLRWGTKQPGTGDQVRNEVTK